MPRFVRAEEADTPRNRSRSDLAGRSRHHGFRNRFEFAAAVLAAGVTGVIGFGSAAGALAAMQDDGSRYVEADNVQVRAQGQAGSAGQQQQQGGAGAAAGAEDDGSKMRIPPLKSMSDSEQQASVDAAIEMMREVAKAYRQAPVLKDEITIRTPNIYGRVVETPMQVTISEDASQLEFIGYRFVRLDDMVYGESTVVIDRYYAAPLNMDLGTTLAAQQTSFIMPHFLLRRAESQADLKRAVTRFIDSGEIEGSQEVELDGEPRFAIYASGVDPRTGWGGEMALLVDPETKFIDGVRMDRWRELQNGQRVTSWAEFDMNPRVLEELEDPITFRTEDREAVSQIADLQARPRGVGEKALPIELTTLDGEKIVLTKPDDAVKVLLLWHSGWPEESASAIEDFKSLMKWTESEDVAVTWYGVNVLAMDPRSEAHETKVRDFWEEHDPGFPIAIDYDVISVSNYGVVKTPVAIVVDRENTIARMLVGYDSSWETKLRRTLSEIFGIETDADADAEAESESGDSMQDEIDAEKAGG